MRSDGRAARLLRAWREDYALRTLLTAPAPPPCARRSSRCTTVIWGYAAARSGTRASPDSTFCSRRCGAASSWRNAAASFHVGRLRRRPGGNILLAELRTVNFIDALVAVLTLQNTLIMVERTAADGNGMLPVSAASSGVIWAAIVAITLRMLRKGLEQTKP